MKWRNGREATPESIKACVPDGWEGLIDRLLRDLITLGWQDGEIWQVKEKFGGLRFYIATGDELVQQRIREAEQESMTTCHECGSPGEQVAIRGWLSIRCGDHRE